jgi:hypothetical protein
MRLFLSLGSLATAGCATSDRAGDFDLASLPALEEYCLDAQRLVTRTTIPMQLVRQPEFDAFVKSKALIEGPTIQQFEWTDPDGRLLGISCKLKSADHLNEVFGPGSAGPDGACQDFNRAVYAVMARESLTPVYRTVVFDPAETVTNEENPGMTGPDWLAPFTLTTVDTDGALRVHTKGFTVDFTDPRFARLPERFRGVHYCHFIAPDHLRDLLAGRAQAGAVIGRRVAVDAAPPSG